MKSFAIVIFTIITITGSGQIQPRIIAPNATDPAINTFTTNRFDHFVYLSDSAPKRNQLFVFLSGTYGRGGSASDFNITAAQAGYHVINLIYPDSIAMVDICENDLDEACYDKAREEVISGIDLVTGLNITRPNSIKNRLIKVLQYLHKNYPVENWGQYFSDDKIRWKKIAIGGQSQGGGHAGYIAKKYKVARVLMFGSPKDFGDAYKKPAKWMFEKSNTPVNRYLAFVHSEDHVGCTFSEQVQIFKTMGMGAYEDLVDVDKEAFPYNYTRTLTATKFASNPHNAPVRDVNSYKQVWTYMLTTKVK